MKRKLFFMGLFASLLVFGQDIIFFYVNNIYRISWIHDGLDVDGNLETLGKFEVGVFYPGDDENILHKFEVDIDDLQYPEGITSSAGVQEVFKDLKDSRYMIKVQAIDAAGNASGWSEAIELGVDRRPPGLPEFIGN